MSVAFSLDAAGRKTGLEFQPPEALEVEPLKERTAMPELSDELFARLIDAELDRLRGPIETGDG